MKKIRTFSESNIEIVEIKKEWYALNGWNGEQFQHCWRVDKKTLCQKGNEEFTIRPIFKGVGDLDEDGEFSLWEVVDYEII